MSTASKDSGVALTYPPVSRLAKGLLDFLGIKSGAWGPRFLGQTINPSIELLDWYTEPYAQWFNVGSLGGAGALAPGTAFGFGGATSDPTMTVGGTLTVPNDECWLMHEFTASYSYAALENGYFGILLSTAGNATSTLEPPQIFTGLGTMPFATGAPAAGGRFATSLARKMFWPPGTICQAISYGMTATAGVVRGVGRVSRFKV